MTFKEAGGIVIFGDSISDGTQSTPNANMRGPDQLARRRTANGSCRAGHSDPRLHFGLAL
jgi:hypothetical protein